MQAKRKNDRDGIYKRPESKVWYASYTTASGARTRRSTGATDRKEAEEILAQWKLEARQARIWKQEPSRTFDEMMLLYIKQGPGQDKRSPERDTYSCKRLYPWFSGMKLTEIGAAEISGYIATRRTAGAAPATINREIGLLSAALNYAKRQLGWTVAENPVIGRRLKTPQGRTRWLSYEQAQMLLDTVKANKRTLHLYDFIRLALNTGMRSGEMLELEWKRVDLQRQTIRLDTTHTKTAKARIIPVNEEARAALISRASFRAQNCPNSPWVFCNTQGVRIASIKKGFRLACERAGIEDFTPHDLRHTCGSWMVNAGVPLPEIRDLLGHSTVQMTERYAHLATENVTAAVQRINRGSSHSRHSQETALNKNDLSA